MTYMYTAEQTMKVFESWGVSEPLPKKNQKVMVSFPVPASPAMAIVTKMKEKSTYGKALYLIEMYDRGLGPIEAN